MGIQQTASNGLALLATGMLAGTFFYGTFNIAPTFHEVPMAVHLSFRVALMAHNSLVVQSLMAAAGLSCAWAAWAFRHQRLPCVLFSTAMLLAIATFLITRFGNVPINYRIKTWSPAALPADWKSIVQTWDFYNGCRTTTAIACFAIIVGNTFIIKRTTY